MKERLTTASLIAMMLILTLATGSEAQVAKEGDVSGTQSVSGTFKAAKIGDDFFLATGENMGVLVSDSGAGPFSDLSGRCVAQVLYVKGVGRDQGHCVYMDRAGDQFVTEFEAPAAKLGAPAENGTYKYLGGTGKFAGLTGQGEWVFTRMRPVAEGTYQGYVKIKGHYQLQ
jgi:hypothetical protein